MKNRLLPLLSTSLLVASTLSAQIITWDFSGNTGSEVSVTGTFSSLGISNATISRGSGISASNNADRFNANKYTQSDLSSALLNSDYFTITINVANGYQFDLDSISFNFERSSTGPVDGALFTSVGGFSIGNGLNESINLNNSTYSYSLFNSSYDSLSGTFEIRLYAFNNTNSSGSFGFEGSGNDISITGSVSAIPEPSAYAIMLGGFTLGAIYYRRRKQQQAA